MEMQYEDGTKDMFRSHIDEDRVFLNADLVFELRTVELESIELRKNDSLSKLKVFLVGDLKARDGWP